MQNIIWIFHIDNDDNMKGELAMNGSNLIRKIHMECPLCDKIHEIEKRTRIAKTIIKGEEVNYEETYYFCKNSDEDENEFVTGKMENENLLNARNAYRKEHDLLTSDQIVAIRERYGLSQVDLAKLLGWGEATISRYESKAIQDQAYDNMLRIIKENPKTMLELLQKNANKFSTSKRTDIRKKITENLDFSGREFLSRQSLESEYVDYQEPCDANGNTLLNIDKLEAVISYYARRVENLFKVKLMKMLWYGDSEFYRKNNRTITGLVYCHDDMGALPVGHYKIVGLENVCMKEEEGFEMTRYHFFANEKIDENILSKEERQVLDLVISKFRVFKSQEIVEYMHDEIAYTKTKDKEVIPFSLAKMIRDF